MKLPVLALCLLSLGLVGCVTGPAPQDQTLSAHYVGDRMTLEMEEIVFTVGVSENTPASSYQNLHVRLSAVVNPKAATGISLYDVNGIVSRLQPRIRAHLIETFPLGRSVPLPSLQWLKGRITQEAQSIFNQHFAKWKHASAFDVQLVVSSYYLTDLSVGPAPQNRPGWW
jgi:hypothetical protein